MYGSLVATSGTNCTIGGWYHGGIHICGPSASHPKDLTSGLKGGFWSGFPLGELPLGESLGCPPSSGWWIEPLGT